MKKIVHCILFLFCVKSYAQQYKFSDAQLWFNLYLEKKINKKFSAHLNQQDRWNENVTQFNFAYADMGLTYKITKNIKVLLDYVFTQKRRLDDSYGSIHQYYAAMTFKKDIRRWRFMYRQMFQFQFNNPYTSYYALTPFYYDRNKFIIKYELNKYFQFYAAEELYIPLNSPQIKGIDRNRTFFGVFYNTFRKQQLELYFMYQNRIQNGEWFKQHNSYDATNYILEKDFVYGIGYSFDF
ncbi:MAG: DUF2490 domain-containing protein [Bacteroidia bacterium]